jgi:signal transduction histidine kinase/ActR/RegA family two-component response regulator
MTWLLTLQWPRESLSRQFAFALMAVIPAIAARWLVNDWIGDQHEFVEILVAVGVATWLTGWRSGVIAALLGVLATEFVFGPRNRLDLLLLHTLAATAGNLLFAGLVIWLTHHAFASIAALRKTNHKLDDDNHRKSDLLAGVAHELRNPLSAIATEIELLKSGKLDPETRRRTLQMVERQAGLMKRLVGDLIDSARIEQQKLVLESEAMQIGAAIDHAVADIRPFTDVRAQKLVTQLPAHPVQVLADPVRMSEILGNLLHNASKFSPAGSVIQVTVTAEAQEVAITVKDTGMGISPGDLRRIFEPFVQRRPAAGQAQGLGLGLSLTRRLVEAHGGTVEARSDGPDKGAQFIVRLPRLMQQAKAPASIGGKPVILATRESSESGDRDPVGSMRLLVVDDNEDAAETLATLLRLKGHHATTAHDGASALRAANDQQPDLVFLDIQLPDMTGHQVAMKLRAQVKGTQPVLVALSGWDSEDDRERSKQAGFDGHLAKPIGVEQIDQTLDLGAAMIRSRQTRTGGTTTVAAPADA